MGEFVNRSTCNCYKSNNRLSVTILDSTTTQILNFNDKYKLGQRLGLGQFGIIRECFDKLTGEVYACKSISKDRLVRQEDLRSVKLEIEIMTLLSGHPNVVDLKAVYEEEDYVHLVMELCAGGELFNQLQKHGSFSENDARVLFRHLMQVIVYCHEMGIVHRDLKPENILLLEKSFTSPIKLADFGLATYIKPGQSLNGTVGSPFYIAPEVLAGGYNQTADVWSAGVILYILLSGVPPFWGKTKSEIFDSVRAANLQFPSDPWSRVSNSAKDLITGMLVIDPSKRLTANQVLTHSWIKAEAETGDETSSLIMGETNTFLMERSKDFSFTSPAVGRVKRNDSPPVFTCQSSFSSFLVENPNPSCPVPVPFSLSSCSESDMPEFSSSIPSMPSFTFFCPCSTVNQENTTKDSSLDKAVTFDHIPKIVTDRRLEIRRGKLSKRNRTFGHGELELAVATESVIRWASCTHIPSSSSLRSSLVF